jgi:hypothetical protein
LRIIILSLIRENEFRAYGPDFDLPPHWTMTVQEHQLDFAKFLPKQRFMVGGILVLSAHNDREEPTITLASFSSSVLHFSTEV